MRLIDADTLIEQMEADAEHLDNAISKMMYYAAISDVKHAPTIEPERKKGKWIKEHWHSDHVRQCSACHVTQTVTTYRGVVNFKFCPYCGVDMRGGA